ncbi:MAG: hypothetical protein PHQ35_01610 [Phycisphaerae bacterium]|nr:hypothetical protein [Phycisphaerae bacterium]
MELLTPPFGSFRGAVLFTAQIVSSPRYGISNGLDAQQKLCDNAI